MSQLENLRKRNVFEDLPNVFVLRNNECIPYFLHVLLQPRQLLANRENQKIPTVKKKTTSDVDTWTFLWRLPLHSSYYVNSAKLALLSKAAPLLLLSTQTPTTSHSGMEDRHISRINSTRNNRPAYLSLCTAVVSWPVIIGMSNQQANTPFSVLY